MLRLIIFITVAYAQDLVSIVNLVSSTLVSGPCNQTGPLLSITNKALGGTAISQMNKFTISGWFRSNNSLNNSMLWMVGDSSNTLNSFLLSAQLRDSLIVQQCNTSVDFPNGCIQVVLTNFDSILVEQQWVQVTAGIDFSNSSYTYIHSKMVLHPSSMNSPQVVSKTQVFQFTNPYKDLSTIVFKNKVNNYFNLDGYCGYINQLIWYAGFFSTDSSQTYDFYAPMIINWQFPLNNFPNYQYASRDYGTLTDNNDPGFNTVIGAGRNFKNGSIIQFVNQKSVFGDRFQFTFWMKMTNMDAASTSINLFTRKTASSVIILQISLVKDSTQTQTYNLLVSVNGLPADKHGIFQLVQDKFYRITIAFYKNYNYYIDNPIPGVTLFDIFAAPWTTTSKINTQVRSHSLYQDSLTDFYYLGDYPTSQSWGTGIVTLFDFKIYTGYHYIINDFKNPTSLGCMVQISELFPSCVMCDNLGQADSNLMCAESWTPVNTSLDQVLNCWGGSYDSMAPKSPCKQIQVQGCMRGTQLSCTVCKDGSQPPCIILPMTYPNGTKEFFVETLQSDQYPKKNITIMAQSCINGYYNKDGVCTKCDSSCLTCDNSSTCASCHNLMYISNTGTCVADCSPKYFDQTVWRCVDQCKASALILNNSTGVYCMQTCPPSMLASKGQCLSQCANGTYSYNKVCLDCHPYCSRCFGPGNLQCKECKSGYYLEDTKCETFCAEDGVFRDEVNHLCTPECANNTFTFSPDLKCLAKCPTTPIIYNEQGTECVLSCAQRKVSQSYMDTDNSARYRCANCAPNCQQCSAVQSNVSDNCYLCDTQFYSDGGNCVTQCNQTNLFSNNYSMQCLSACPPPLFTINSTYKTCTVNCPDGQVKSQGVCQDNCSDTQFALEGVCISCAPECTQCHGGVATLCNACSTGYYLHLTTCTAKCPQEAIYQDQNNSLCVSQCDPTTYILDDGNIHQCWIQCPSDYIIQDQTCVSDCKPGYFNMNGNCTSCDPSCSLCTGQTNKQCQSCSKDYYLDGTTCDTNCAEHPDFYMNPFSQLCQFTCDKILYSVVDQLLCVKLCPKGYFLQDNQFCLKTCTLSFYGDLESGVCLPCAPQCINCTGPLQSQCSQCAEQYYLQGTTCTKYCSLNLYKDSINMLCVSQCPNGYYMDDDKSGNRNCCSTCPQYKYLSRNLSTCFFNCPDGTYNDQTIMECSKCAIECKTCRGSLSTDCIECAPTFQLNQIGACVGQCPQGTFDNGLRCQQCSFSCVDCETNQFKCTKCRGDRTNLPLCNCQDGYYDDGVQDQCLQCVAPCVTCQSPTICLSCYFNKETPSCTCSRPPPIASDYCISCTVAFPSIYMTDDLQSIFIDFGYNVALNSNDPFFESYQNCLILFPQKILLLLGNIPTCYQLQSDQTKIIVNLSPGVTIPIEQELIFNAQSITDGSSQPCIGTFMTDIRTPHLQAPSNPINPEVVVNYPSSDVSLCLDFNVSIDLIKGDGLRGLKFSGFTLKSSSGGDSSHQQAVNKQISKYKDRFNIPSLFLQANSEYSFALNYKNFLNISGSTTFVIKTTNQKQPMIVSHLNQSGLFYSNKPISIPLNILPFQCSGGTITKIKQDFLLKIKILDEDIGSVLDDKQIILTNPDYSYTYIIQAFKTQTTHNYKISVSVTGKSDSSLQASYTSSIYIQPTQLQVEFITQSRLISQDQPSFDVKLKAWDDDVSSQQKFIGLTFQWSCIDLGRSTSCKYADQSLVSIKANVDSFTIKTQNLPTNTTFAFFCNVTKDNRYTLARQYIIIVEVPMEEQPFSDVLNENDIGISPSSDISLSLVPPLPYYMMILYDFKLIYLNQLNGPSANIIVYNYENRFEGTKRVTFYLTNTLLAQTFNIITKLINPTLLVYPQIGDSIDDEFTFNVSLSYEQSNNLRYQFTLYFFKQDLQTDISKITLDHGLQLTDRIASNIYKTQLPAGPNAGQVFVLVYVTDITTNSTGYSYKRLTVVAPDVINQRRNILRITSLRKKYRSLTYNYLVLIELQNMELMSCLNSCSVRGDCSTDYQCQCDPDWYLSDCSGGLTDQQGQVNLLSSIQTQLFNHLNDTSKWSKRIVLQSLQLLYSLTGIVYLPLTDVSLRIPVIVESINEQIQIDPSTENRDQTFVSGNSTKQNPLVTISVSNSPKLPLQKINLAMFLISKLVDFRRSYLNENIYKLTRTIKQNGFRGMEPGQQKSFNYKSCVMDLSFKLGMQLQEQLYNFTLVPEQELKSYVNTPTIMTVDYGSEETQSEEDQVFSRLLMSDLEDYDGYGVLGRLLMLDNYRSLVDDNTDQANISQTSTNSTNSTEKSNISNTSSISSNQSNQSLVSNSSQNGTKNETSSVNSTNGLVDNVIPSNSNQSIPKQQILNPIQKYKLYKEVWKYNLFQDKLPYPDQGFPVVYLQLNDTKNQEFQLQKLGVTYEFNYSLALFNMYTNYGQNYSLYTQYLNQLNYPILNNLICIQNLDGNTSQWQAHTCNTTLIYDNDTLSQISCDCNQTAYTTVINDNRFKFKSLFDLYSSTIDKNNVLILIGGFSIFFFIALLVGWRKDFSDWKMVAPLESGFAMSRLRKQTRQNDEDEIEDPKKVHENQDQVVTMIKKEKKLILNKPMVQGLSKSKFSINNVTGTNSSQSGLENEDSSLNSKVALKQDSLKRSANLKSAWQDEPPESNMDSNLREVSSIRPLHNSKVEIDSSKEISQQNLGITMGKIKSQQIDKHGTQSSVYSIKNIHKHHSILGLYFRFYRNLGRMQRVQLVFGRHMILLGITGFFVALQTISFTLIIIFTNFVGLALRVIYRPLRSLNQKTNHTKGQCQYKFLSYMITLIHLGFGFILTAQEYLTIDDKLVKIWLITFGFVMIFELLLADLLVQAIYRFLDYIGYLAEVRKREEERQDAEAIEARKMYGDKQNESDQEIMV